MNDRSPEPQNAASARPLTRLALVAGMLLVLGACSGSTSSPAPSTAASTEPSMAASSEASPDASGATACLDASTMAIITELTASGADVEAILTEKGDELVTGLQSFTPPADAMTWRDDLVAAIQAGDAQAVQDQLAMIGSEVSLETC
jgi:hypothetical protein